MILLAKFWCSCESKMVSKTDCNSTLHSTSPTLTKPLLGGDAVCHSVGMCFWLLLARSAPAHSEGKSPIMHLKLSRIRESIIYNTERIRMKQKAHEGLVRSSHDAETSSSWTIPGVPTKWYEKPLSHFRTLSLLLKAVRGITFHTGVRKHHWIRNKKKHYLSSKLYCYIFFN